MSPELVDLRILCRRAWGGPKNTELWDQMPLANYLTLGESFKVNLCLSVLYTKWGDVSRWPQQSHPVGKDHGPRIPVGQVKMQDSRKGKVSDYSCRESALGWGTSQQARVFGFFSVFCHSTFCCEDTDWFTHALCICLFSFYHILLNKICQNHLKTENITYCLLSIKAYVKILIILIFKSSLCNPHKAELPSVPAQHTIKFRRDLRLAFKRNIKKLISWSLRKWQRGVAMYSVQEKKTSWFAWNHLSKISLITTRQSSWNLSSHHLKTAPNVPKLSCQQFSHFSNTTFLPWF